MKGKESGEMKRENRPILNKSIERKVEACKITKSDSRVGKKQ